MRGLRWLALAALALGGCKACHHDTTAASDASAASLVDAQPALPRRLVVQRVAEIHLDGPTGPIIGRVHPGVELEATPVNAGHVRVSLPAAFRTWSNEKVDLVGFVDESVFSAMPRPRVVPTFPPNSRLVKDVSRLDLAAKPNDQTHFAATICGEVHVLSPPNVSPAQVAQFHDGVEIVGFIEDAHWVHRGLARCGARAIVREGDRLELVGGATSADRMIVPDVPPGFVKGDLDGPDELATRMARGDKAYWLVVTAKGTTACHEWAFARLPDKDTALVRRDAITVDGKRVFASFGTHYEKRGLTLFGPHWTDTPLDKLPTPPLVGGYKCGIGYSFVGLRDGALRMSSFGDSKRVIAWHEDDEERWYPTLAACDAMRAAADDVLKKNPDATPPGGVHVDCFDELDD